VATGITHFAWLPPSLRDLPADKVTHSSAHAEPARFRGADVTVIGGGSSAIDLAALLHEAGARVRLVTRRAKLPVHDRMRLPRPWRDRIAAPVSSVGPGWRSCFFTSCAPIVHRMSAERRVKWVRNELGPAAGWFMADRIAPVPVLHGQSPAGAAIVDDRVRLSLVDGDGKPGTLDTDHLIAATGYRPDVARLPFLDAGLQQAIATLEQAPVVSLQFESSVPGLYFTGPAAAFSFGPVVRFAAGARFAAPRIARHLAATARQRPAAAQDDKTMFGIGARA
jgi:thioredoxin reductase